MLSQNKDKTILDMRDIQNPWRMARIHNCDLWDHNHLAILKTFQKKPICINVVDNGWMLDGHSSMIEWYNYDNSLHFEFDLIERYIDACDTNLPIYLFSVLPWGNDSKCEYTNYEQNGDPLMIHVEPCDTIYTRLWGIFLSEFLHLAEKKKWLGRIYFAYDAKYKKMAKKCQKVLKSTVDGKIKIRIVKITRSNSSLE